MPGKTFSVQLKQKLSEEKSEYKGVKKMLVISDIEGNFEAFRKLLQGNQVIDENFNWTFGKDHLVLAGDFVDRGVMVNRSIMVYLFIGRKSKSCGRLCSLYIGQSRDHEYG
jgi:inorganic pyrophosphatase/exopolyphosphatase